MQSIMKVNWVIDFQFISKITHFDYGNDILGEISWLIFHYFHGSYVGFLDCTLITYRIYSWNASHMIDEGKFRRMGIYPWQCWNSYTLVMPEAPLLFSLTEWPVCRIGSHSVQQRGSYESKVYIFTFDHMLHHITHFFGLSLCRSMWWKHSFAITAWITII